MSKFVLDTFTGTSGTNLSAHTPDTGGTWTYHPVNTGTFVLSNANRLRTNTTGDCVVYNPASSISADYSVRAEFYQLSGDNTEVGLCGRLDTSARTFYYVRVIAGSSTINLYKCVAGTFTQLGSSISYTLSTGIAAIVELRMSGTSISVLINGNNFLTVTDSSITAAGKAGIRSNVGTSSDTAGLHIDNFTAVYNFYWVGGSGKWSQPLQSNMGFSGTAGNSITTATPLQGSGSFVNNSATANNFVLDGSGGVYTNASGESVAMLNLLPNYADHTVELFFKCLSASSTTEIGLIARGSKTAENHYLLQFSNNNINLYKCVNGTYTQLGTNYAFTPTVNVIYTLRLCLNGTSLKAYLGNTLVISVTDSTYTANGYAGIRASEASGQTTGTHATQLLLDTYNWSCSSGGTPLFNATLLPSTNDNVVFDYNSYGASSTATMAFDTNISINSLVVDPFVYGGSATAFTFDFGTGNMTMTLNGVNDFNDQNGFQGSNSYPQSLFLLGRSVTTLGSQNFNVVMNSGGTWENLSSKATFGSITVNCPSQTIGQSSGENAPAGGFYAGQYTINSLTLTAGTLQLTGLPFGKDSSVLSQTWEYFNSNNNNTRTLDFNASTYSNARQINITNLWNVGGTGFTMANNQYATLNFLNELREYDSMTGTSGKDLSTHTGETNATWASLGGSYTGTLVFTDSNRVRANSTSNTLYYDTSNPPYFVDGSVQADIYVASLDNSNLGIMGRFNSASISGYLVHYSSSTNQWILYSVINDTYTSIGTYSQALTVGQTYTVKMNFSGSTITVSVNDTTIISVTDTAVTGAGGIAIRMTGITTTPTNTKGLHLDNMIATPNNAVIQLLGQAGTAASDASYGLIAWTNPNNAKLQDNAFATVSF